MPGTRAALLLIGTACVAAHAFGEGAIASPAPGPPAASEPAGWKQIYETGQTVYYVDAARAGLGSERDVETLLAFKVPQVVDGAQAWSMVSRMRLNCDSDQVATIDNTFYALPMGAGRAVQTQPADNEWHEPDPGSLGELVWSTSCGKS
jgi:surface-adhesin protein E